MTREPGIRQREIVGKRIRFEDTELITKYTLPFIDGTWKVRFVVLDLLGGPPKALEAPIILDEDRLRTDAPTSMLRSIESIPLERFPDLVHFDPWRAFRGVSGVDRSWIEAIFAANIARPFDHEGARFKIHDLAFDPETRSLETILAKDDLFRPRAFRAGEIDLFGLRPQRPEFRESEIAKAL